MTDVYLLNVPYENNYKDTVYFTDLDEQIAYMNSKRVTGLSFTNISYQRKDNIIRVNAHIDTLYKCNYVQYRNANFSNKWFYAFITDMKYINEERTDVYIETDVIQSWMFNPDGSKGFTVKPSFVEREHVSDDTVGLHTVPEQVETGEYICQAVTHKKTLKYWGIIVGATIDISARLTNNDTKFPNVAGTLYNNVYSGVSYYYVVLPSVLQELLTSVAEKGQSDGIVSIFMCPSHLIETTMEEGHRVDILKVVGVKGSGVINWNEVILGDGMVDELVDALPSLPNANGFTTDAYTPRNKKLLTYPYCYLMASNNSGGANIYHYELFKSGVEFKIISSITPGMSIRLIPQNYAGIEENNSEGLNLGKFPVCAWTSDVYTNWLTQNSINIAMDVVGGVAQVGAGVAMAVGTGGAGAILGGGSVLGGVTTVANTIGQIYQHSLIPPAVSGNLNSGDVTFSSGNLTFSLYSMSIKKEYAQIIDEYFDMFGYKVARVKVPHSAHRPHYWYTKTVDVNIDGAIPGNDLEKIKQCYNNGITFWRSGSTMGLYSVDNHY